MPITLNPVPEVVICEIVVFTFPVLVTATDCVLLLPTVTLPKLKLVGLAVSCIT